MKYIGGFFLGFLFLVTGNSTAQTITLDLNQFYQTIDRWENGGFLPSGIAPYVIDDVVDLSVDSLGINRLRLEIRSGTEYDADNYQMYIDSIIDYDTWRSLRYATVNDNNDPNTINWAGFHFTELDEKIESIIIPFRNRLLQNGSDLYVNLCFVAFTDQINYGSGGTIIHQDPEEYAEFIEATFLHMEDQFGFVPNGVEVILEPNVASFGNGTLVGECLVAAGNRLNNIGYYPDFIACSNTNLNGAINFYPSFTAVSGVSNYWTEYSFHAYAGRTDANLIQIASNANASGVKTSMLEWWANGNTYKYLHDCLRLGNVSSYEFKGSFGAPGNDWNSGLLQIVDNGSNNFDLALQRPTKYFRHYFNLIKPGAVRYEATSNDENYDAVVFINPDGMLLLNVDATTAGAVEIAGMPPGTYRTIHSLGDGKQEPDPYWQISDVDTVSPGEQITLLIEGEGVYSIEQLTSNLPTSVTGKNGVATTYIVSQALGLLTVKAIGANAIDRVSIYSGSGQQVYTQSFNSSSSVLINCSELTEGLYIIRINGHFTEKVFLSQH